MKRTGYKSVTAARSALARAGYHLAFTPPGTPEKWQRLRAKRSRTVMPALAILRIDKPRSQEWEIRDYPLNSAG